MLIPEENEIKVPDSVDLNEHLAMESILKCASKLLLRRKLSELKPKDELCMKPLTTTMPVVDSFPSI
jgi:hypothetical protein